MVRYLVMSALCLGALTGADPVAVQWSIPEVPKLRTALAAQGFANVLPPISASGSLVSTDSWQRLPHFMTSCRGWLRIGPAWAGASTLTAAGGLRLPPGLDPAATNGVRGIRDGGWWLWSVGNQTPVFIDDVQSTGPGHLLRCTGLGSPWLDILPSPSQESARYVMQLANAAMFRATLSWSDNALWEHWEWPGAHLPLGRIDSNALAGFPHDAQVFALAIDPNLASQGSIIAGVCASLLNLTIPPAPPIHGTVAFARLVNDGWILSIPGNDSLDAWLTTHLSPLVDNGSQLSSAREQPIVVNWPGLGRVFVRRSAQGWIFGNQSGPVHVCGTDAPPPFPAQAIWRNVDQAGAILRWSVSSSAPAMCLTARLTIDPASPESTVLIEGQRGPLSWLGFLLTDGQGRLPELVALIGKQRQQQLHAPGLRLLRAGQDFAQLHNGQWPESLPVLARHALPHAASIGNQIDSFLGVPGQPQAGPAWRYRAPTDRTSPVLVSCPGLFDNPGSLIGHAHGLLGMTPGPAMWDSFSTSTGAKVITGESF